MRRPLLFTLTLTLFSFFSQAADYYWIGGTGDWSQISNWATTSGGSTVHSSVPGSNDNVYFDANSFSSNGQTVTLNVAVNVASMDWTGVNYTVTLDGNVSPTIYGDFILNSNLTWDAGSYIYLEGIGTHSLDPDGVTFSETITLSDTGTYNLLDSLVTSGTINIDCRNFNSNGHKISCYRFANSGTSIQQNISLSNSKLYAYRGIYAAFDFSNSNLNLDADEAYFYLTGNGASFSSSSAQNFHYVEYTDPTPGQTSSVSVASGSFIDTVISNGTTNYCYVRNSIRMNYFLAKNDVRFYVDDTAHVAEIWGDIVTLSNSDCVFDTLKLVNNEEGQEYQIHYTGSLTVNDSIYIEAANCIYPITFRSSYLPTPADFIVKNGSVNLDYAYIYSIDASGGADFNGTNIIKHEDVTGWDITMLQSPSFYWVGGTGTWDDPTQWSHSSGGSALASIGCYPRYNDTAIFDENSFSAGSQRVTISSDEEVYNMFWTNTTDAPEMFLDYPGDLNLYGSIETHDSMSWNSDASTYIYFVGDSVQNIDFGGLSMEQRLYFTGTGTYNLLDSISNTSIVSVQTGTFNSNDHEINCWGFGTSNSNAPILNLGESTINITYWSSYSSALYLAAGSATIDAENTTINVLGAGNPSLQGSPFIHLKKLTTEQGVTLNFKDNNLIDTVIINGDGLTINNANNIEYLYSAGDVIIRDQDSVKKAEIYGDFTVTSNNTPVFDTLLFYDNNEVRFYTFNDNASFKIQDSVLFPPGNCTNTHYITSSSNGGTASDRATIIKPDGYFYANYYIVNSIAGTGGADFIIDDLVSEDGNNTGLTTSDLGPFDLFWVGGTGEWSDATNWALSSGGTPQSASGCVPSDNINAVFDANSFSSSGQIVYITNADQTRNFIWDGVTNSPILRDTISFGDFNIYGSIELDPNMTIDLDYGFELNGLDTFTIDMNGQSIVQLNINTDGQYILLDSLSIAEQITHTKGGLKTDGYKVRCENYYTNTSNVHIYLDLGTSWFIITGSSTSVNYYPFQLQKGTSYGHLDAAQAVLFFSGTDNPYGSIRIYSIDTIQKIIFNTRVNVLGLASSSQVDTIIFNNENSSNITTGIKFGYLESQGDINFNTPSIDIGKAVLYSNFTSLYNITFDTLELYANNGPNTYNIKSGTTIEVSDSVHFDVGDCHNQHLIRSSTKGSLAYFQVDTGYAHIDHYSLQSVYATGDAIFSATNIYETDGRDDGWNVQMKGLDSLYWIGSTGNWNDFNNWSQTSGGSSIGSSGCMPDGRTSVFFDDNSFSGSAQTVTLDTIANCYSFIASGATGEPAFSGSNSLEVYGDFILTDSVNFNITSDLYFSSNDATDIDFAGNIKSAQASDIYFDGLGSFDLLDSLNSNGTINISRGTFSTNNYKMNSYRLLIEGSEDLTINLGKSTVEADANFPYNVIEIDHTSLSLDADESKIRGIGIGSNGISCSVPDNDLVFNVIETYGTYADVSLDAAVVDSVIINSTNYANYYSSDTANYVYSSGNLSIRQELQVDELVVDGNLSSSYTSRFHAAHADVYGNLSLGSSVIFDTLLLHNEGPSTVHKFSINDTCYVNDSLYINSNGCYKTTIQSTNTSSIGYVSMPSSSGFFGQYLEVESLSAIGGGDFNVGINSSDLGNNTGWDFNGPSYSLQLKYKYVCIDTPGVSTVTAAPDGFPLGYWWRETVSPFDTFNTGIDTIMVSAPADYVFVINYGTSCLIEDSIIVRVGAPAGGLSQDFANNAGDNSWFNCSNWDKGLIPDSISDATITAGDTVIIQSGQNAHCYNLTNNGYIKLNGGTLNVYGSIIMDGAMIHDNGTLRITGSGTDSITSSSRAVFDSIDLDKNGTLSISSTTEIEGYLSLIDGYIQTNATDSLIFKDGASNSGGIDESFILGPVYKRGENSFKFPIGDSSILAQIEISAPSTSGSNTFKAEYFYDKYSNTADVTSPIVKVSSEEYWTLDKISGTGAIRVKLYYNDSARSFIVDPQYIHVGRYDGSDWISEGQNSYVQSDSSGNVESDYVSNFSPFTFAAINGINPVPVKFISIEAQWSGQDAAVKWSTATEVNNELFEVQRSLDGVNFETIVTVKSKNGNSNQVQDYVYVDPNARELNSKVIYYRIKQVDYDGKFEYSTIVSLNSEQKFIISPNPTSGNIEFLNLEKEVTVSVISIDGTVISTTTLSEDKSSLDLSEYGQGNYIIRVESEDEIEVHRVLLIN
ncbi:T9SS type A sorting domain-containing protein [bacterium]|nr:T9SS type A sorting domain-containing protein [bacterium]